MTIDSAPKLRKRFGRGHNDDSRKPLGPFDAVGRRTPPHLISPSFTIFFFFLRKEKKKKLSQIVQQPVDFEPKVRPSQLMMMAALTRKGH